MPESQLSYIGFGHSPTNGIVKLYSNKDTQSISHELANFEQLSTLEKRTLELDLSPALYHWNDLVHVSTNNQSPQFVYCRGKDFIPFSGLDYVEQIRETLKNPQRGPFTLQIQPNQVCNDACTFCCTAVYRENPLYKGKLFSWEELRILIENFSAQSGVVVEIIGGGEPTIHPRFLDLLNLIGDRGLKAYLFTNGTQFTDKSHKLNKPLLESIARNCVILTVSLDGFRNRSHVHTKVPFEKTLGTFEGMRYIDLIRDRTKMAFYNSYILTGGKSQASNIDDLYECVSSQAGWVDSIHIQNDFVSLSHLEFDKRYTQEVLQRTFDTFFSKTYIYFNYPLISLFNLNVPYELSLHNVGSSEFPLCLRGRLAPTVECGTNKVWPCGKYAGEGVSPDRHEYKTIPEQLVQLRNSPDYRNGLHCNPCIHSSYNRSLKAIFELLQSDPHGKWYHFYQLDYLTRIMS
jgi:hypothetical protein